MLDLLSSFWKFREKSEGGCIKMNFRRIPFQFSTTDPVKRQAELQKRFGLPAKKDNMYIDITNPGAMRVGNTSSPRLQHRVPIFVEGSSEPVRPSVDSQNNIDVGRKPRIRVVPIEIEGVDSTSNRQRNFSGPSPETKDKSHQNGFFPSYSSASLKRPAATPTSKSANEPKVCNIPISIDRASPSENAKLPVSDQQEKSTPRPKKPDGNNVSNLPKNSAPLPKQTSRKPNVSKVNNPVPEKSFPEQISIQKIDTILNKLKEYLLEVEKFSGANKDKQYLYLDEMLTRCMLQLDNIDTMGNEAVRLSRKAAIKQVEAAVNLLESKVPKDILQSEMTKKELPEAVSNGASEDCKNVEMEGVEDNATTSDSKACAEKSGVDNVSDMQDDLPQVELNDKISADKEMNPVNSQLAIVAEITAGVDSEPVIEEPPEEEVNTDLGSFNKCGVERAPLVVDEMSNVINCEGAAGNADNEMESEDISVVSERNPKCKTELTMDNDTNVQDTTASLTFSADNLDNSNKDVIACT